MSGIPYRSRRDYRFEYTGEAIGAIITHNCHGCTIPEPDTIAQFGPGGDCAILATVAIGDPNMPIPQLLDNGRTIRCTNRRVDPPNPAQPPQVESLFDGQ